MVCEKMEGMMKRKGGREEGTAMGMRRKPVFLDYWRGCY
jgi:hypothetical protein